MHTNILESCTISTERGQPILVYGDRCYRKEFPKKPPRKINSGRTLSEFFRCCSQNCMGRLIQYVVIRVCREGYLSVVFSDRRRPEEAGGKNLPHSRPLCTAERERREALNIRYQSNQQGSENFMYYILCDANNVVSFFFLLNGTVAIPGRGSLQEAAGGVVCQGGPDGGPGQRHSAHVASPSGAWFSSFFPTAAAAAFLPCRPPLHLRRPRGLVAFLCAAHVDSLAGPVGF